jgi:hypothetical protein
MKRAIIGCLLLMTLAAQPQKKTESFWAKLLRIAGVSASPGALRGDDQAASGDIWLATVAEKPVLRRLTRDGGYQSPIFDSRYENIFALKEGGLYRIGVGGDPPIRLRALDGVSKLVGASHDDPDQLLVVTEDSHHTPGAAMLSVGTGTLTRIPDNPNSAEDRGMLAHLKGWERVYGDTRLYCENNEKEGPGDSTIEFSDVYLRKGNGPPLNLTMGNGVSSSQPSLSSNGGQVVFIRAWR